MYIYVYIYTCIYAYIHVFMCTWCFAVNHPVSVRLDIKVIFHADGFDEFWRCSILSGIYHMSAYVLIVK